MNSRLISVVALSGVLASGAFAIAWSATPKAAKSSSVMVATRRLSESQYRNIVADLFGADIKINGRFEPDRRDDGLLAVGAAKLSISAAGFEQYYSMDKSVSDQVLDDRHRAKFVTCPAVDAKCTAEFVRGY